MATDKEKAASRDESVPASKPSPKAKPRRRPAKPNRKETFIVGHDGNRVPTSKYFAATDSEPTFIVGLDGKRVESRHYKDGS